MGAADIPAGFGGITFHPGARLYADDDKVMLSVGRTQPTDRGAQTPRGARLLA
nr:hypothetical protein [Streptomyces sp. GbtcB7]